MRIAALFLLLCAVASAQSLEQQILQTVNAERRARGVAPLREDPQLTTAASSHSRNMERRNFFSHDDPDKGNLRQRLKAAGVDCTACAENIFSTSPTRDLARAVVRAWMNSRGHRENLLNRMYTHTGVGVETGKEVLITQIFAAR